MNVKSRWRGRKLSLDSFVFNVIFFMMELKSKCGEPQTRYLVLYKGLRRKRMILNNHNVPVNSQNHVKSCYSSSQVTADTLQQVFPAILRVISSSGRIRSFCFELDCLCMTHGKIIKCGSSCFVKQWSGRFFFYDLLQAAARWSLLHNAQILIHDVCPPPV